MAANDRREQSREVRTRIAPLEPADDRGGTELISRTLGRRPVGPYQIQAAIAAVHDEAAAADTTDWPQILALYEVLERVSPGPAVTLNHAVAVAMCMVRGPRSR